MQQRSKINNECSSWGNTISGVPQGFILGTLLFKYISNIDVKIAIYADDNMQQTRALRNYRKY